MEDTGTEAVSPPEFEGGSGESSRIGSRIRGSKSDRGGLVGKRVGGDPAEAFKEKLGSQESNDDCLVIVPGDGLVEVLDRVVGVSGSKDCVCKYKSTRNRSKLRRVSMMKCGKQIQT